MAALWLWSPAAPSSAAVSEAEPAAVEDARPARERLRELDRYLGPAEQVALARAEALVREGRSEVVSGTHLAERKISTLDPNEDIEAVNARGRRMIASGEAKIEEGRRIMGALADRAAARRGEEAARAAAGLRLEAERLGADAALEKAASEVLSKCWAAGYETVLFDTVLVVRGDAVSPAPAERRNAVYDALVRADETRFSVSVPVNPRLEAVGAEGRRTLVCDNAGAFSDRRVALLAIEVLAPSAGDVGLLSFGAIDVEDFREIVRSVYVVEGLSDYLPGTELSGEAAPPPVGCALTEADGVLRSLAAANPPYRFTVDSRALKDPFRARAAEAYLRALLVRGSDLFLVADDYIGRAYGGATAEGGADLSGLSDAALGLIAARGEDEPDTFALRARAEARDRVLHLGRFRLESPPPPPEPKAVVDAQE